MKSGGNKDFWERNASLYDRNMKKGENTQSYTLMYKLMQNRLNSEMSVLELATGTGLVAQNIAAYVKHVEATDFSEEMIKQAKAKPALDNLHFAVADACSLPYVENSFDAVIISNALHIMPDPEKALSEIKRVLKNDGLLIAPNFAHGGRLKGGVIIALSWMTGFKVYSRWRPEEYMQFISDNGFCVTYSKVLKASLPLTYVEAKKT